MTPLSEPSRNVPLAAVYDVIVCGAGPAGIAAAISAARNGARTLLLESQGCLGGIWTAGLLCWIIDSGNKGGVMREIIDELERREARTPFNSHRDWAYDPEAMKLLLEDLCREAGVDIQLYTRVASALREKNRLHAILTESKSGRQAWQAKVFIDTTGDGDLGARAGCSFALGRPESGETQPMTLQAVVGGIHAGDIPELIGGGVTEPKIRLYKEICAGGYQPSYTRPTLFRIDDTLFALASNHQYGASPLDAASLTQATMNARQEVNRIVKALRSLGGRWAGLRLVASAEHIGVREGRRLAGLYEVNEHDLANGREHPDGICRVTFKIDVHSTNPKTSRDYTEENKRVTKHYDIPLRALIAAEIDNLLMAGRCISGDFLAHASYRVTGNAVAMGEAAGACAALAAQGNVAPRAIPYEDVLDRIASASVKA